MGPGIDRYIDRKNRAPGTYRYKVLAEDLDNWSEAVIQLGSAQDRQCTVVSGMALGVDAAGELVYGLFDAGPDVTSMTSSFSPTILGVDWGSGPLTRSSISIRTARSVSPISLSSPTTSAGKRFTDE